MRMLYFGVSLTVGKQMTRLTHRKRNIIVVAEIFVSISRFNQVPISPEASAQIQLFLL